MKNKYEVIVVGAGPAGSTAAFLLASKFKKDVLLIDKFKFPRDKLCGGYLTRRIFDRFDYLRSEMNSIIEVPTYGSYFYGPNLLKLEWIEDKPVGYLVLRPKFDNYLKELAISEGVTFIGGNKVRDLLLKEHEVKVLLQNGSSYSAELVIGADGVRSIIARLSGIYEKSISSSKGLGLVNEFKVDRDFINECYMKVRPTYYFYGFANIIGYTWLFPKKDRINIGIGGPSKAGRELRQGFPRFVRFLQGEGLIPSYIMSNIRPKAAMIPTSTALYLKKSYSDRVLLAGDALGVASSISGEGIYQSMASGEDAAIAVEEAFQNGRFDGNFLKLYEEIWKRDLAKELKMGCNIMRLGSADNREELLTNMSEFFEKMHENKEIFRFFVKLFFGI